MKKRCSLLVICSTMILTGVAAPLFAGPPLEKQIAQAVQDFEPLWRPAPDELEGVTIGLDPLYPKTETGADAADEDRALLTTGFLYHYILQAGGLPISTRRDPSESSATLFERRQTRVARATQAECALILTVEYSFTPPHGVFLLTGAPHDDRSIAAARTLAEEMNGAVGVLNNEELDDSLTRLLLNANHADTAACRVRFSRARKCGYDPVGLRQACMRDAQSLYRGIQSYCSQVSMPNPIDAEQTKLKRKTSRSENIARDIWPEGPLPADRVNWFCRRFIQEAVTCPSLVYFDVTARLDDDEAVLRGATNVPLIIKGLTKALHALGVDNVRSEIRTLPDHDKLSDALFGVCRAPAALTYRLPSEEGLQTQLLFGEPLMLLDATESHFLLLAGDGYWGWVTRAAVTPMTSDQFDEYLMLPEAVVLRDIETDSIRIPRGALARIASGEADSLKLRLPNGSVIDAPADAVRQNGMERSTADARLQYALDLLYTPYVFGGVSPLGLDCSGMVANASIRAGFRPARDAWQQAFAGRLTAASWRRSDLRPGDQIFFINESGKVYHTGLALDAKYVIHATAPCVQIGAHDAALRLYDEELDLNFFIAKRP